MTLYLLIDHRDYYNHPVVGVYSSMENLEHAVVEHFGDKSTSEWDVIEIELDAPPFPFSY